MLGSGTFLELTREVLAILDGSLDSCGQLRVTEENCPDHTIVAKHKVGVMTVVLLVDCLEAGILRGRLSDGEQVHPQYLERI